MSSWMRFTFGQNEISYVDINDEKWVRWNDVHRLFVSGAMERLIADENQIRINGTRYARGSSVLKVMRAYRFPTSDEFEKLLLGNTLSTNHKKTKKRKESKDLSTPRVTGYVSDDMMIDSPIPPWESAAGFKGWNVGYVNMKCFYKSSK